MLTLLIVFFSSLYVYKFPFFSGISISPMRFFVVLSIALFPFAAINRRIIDLKVFVFVLIPIVIGLVDYFRAEFPDYVLAAFYTQIEKAAILLFVYIAVRSSTKAERTIRMAFVLSSVIPSSVTLLNAVQFYFIRITPTLPFQPFLPDQLFYSAGTYYNLIFRFASTFQDPNYYGLYCIIVIIVCYSLLFDPETSKNWKTISILLLSINHLGLLLTFSITSYIVILFVYLLLFVLRLMNRGRHFRMKTIIYIMIAFALLPPIVLLVLNSEARIVSQIAARINLRNQNFAGDLLGDRMSFFVPAIDAIREHPFLGVGKGNFWSYNSSAASPVAHNLFLTAIVNHGFVLGALSLSWLLLVFSVTIRSRNITSFLCVAAFLVFTLSYMVDYETLYVVWGIILGSYYRRPEVINTVSTYAL